jgi:N-acetylmuramoyl-L-alanine amidase
MRLAKMGVALAMVPVAALAACGGSGSAASKAGVPKVGGSSPPGAQRGAADPGKGTLAGFTVVLDPGHNGGNEKHPEIINKLVPAGPFKKPCNTTGTATVSGYSEHAFNWDVAVRLRAILERAGAKVVMTRPNDAGVGPCVNERAAIANKAHANAAIAIHADGAAPSGYGFHVIEPQLIKGYTDSIVAPSRKLGTAIRGAFHTGTGEPYSSYLGKSGLDVRDDLGGLNLSKVPAVFIECGNMRNPADAARETSAAWRQKAAQALATGLADFLSQT